MTLPLPARPAAAVVRRAPRPLGAPSASPARWRRSRRIPCPPWAWGRSRSNPRSASRCASSCRSRSVPTKMFPPSASRSRRRNAKATAFRNCCSAGSTWNARLPGRALVITNARTGERPDRAPHGPGRLRSRGPPRIHAVHGSAGDRGAGRGRRNRAARSGRRAAAGTPSAREARRPAPPRARTSTRTAPAPATAPIGAEAKGKPAPQKGRAVAKAAPKRPPPAAAERPRLSLSSGAPGTGAEAPPP